MRDLTPEQSARAAQVLKTLKDGAAKTGLEAVKTALVSGVKRGTADAIIVYVLLDFMVQTLSAIEGQEAQAAEQTEAGHA